MQFIFKTNFIQFKGKVKKIYEIIQIEVYMNSYITVKLSLDFWYSVPLFKTKSKKPHFF